MALTITPEPVLDNRNGDSVTAQAIGALPTELSDRSDSNPAVVIIEACGAMFDKLIYQLNRWPRAVVQKALNLAGITLIEATAAAVTQTFTLSNPFASATTIPQGTQVSNTDGSIVFETVDDLTIAAYASGTGTITITAGSATVTCSTTGFTTGSTWVGYQIRGASGDWYTILSVETTSSLTISATASATQTAVSWVVGPITGTVSAQCTEAGAAGNVGAGKLTTLVSSPSGVASTTNTADAAGGTDQETNAAAVDRAPVAFAARDIACSAEDYATFALQTIGGNGRARARSNYNDTTSATGYVTIGLISPTWTTASAATASEIAAVLRDIAGRSFVGTTTTVLACTISTFNASGSMFGCCVVRNSNYDATTVKVKIAEAINTYLNPLTYPWAPDSYTDGYRPIYVADLIQVLEDIVGIDRVYTINASGYSVPCVGMDYRTSAASMTFTASSASVSSVGAADYANITAGTTILIDSTNNVPYLVITKSGGNALTLHTTWAGTAGAISNVPFFTSADTNLTNWRTLPYSNLSIESASPAASLFVVGSV